MKGPAFQPPLFRLLACGLLILSADAVFAQYTEDTGSSPVAAESEGKAEPEGNLSQQEGLRLNFRGVPLTTVLDYLSKAAGFVIILDTEVRGTVDVWSHQPLSKEEAVELLNTVLNQKGYAAIRNERTLTIVDQDVAKQRDLPVKTGNDPDKIPKTDEMVHQIIPLRHADAVELLDNISPLLPSYASVTANESSNAIVLTDTQTNVRRIAEIVRALDTSISSISTIRVFPLTHALATEIAKIVTQIFEVETDNQDRRRAMARFFGRRSGLPGMDDEGQGESEARQAASRVVAVADEGTNSLVVSAPEDLMPVIENLVNDIDKTPVAGVPVVRVFSLAYADATEVADMINELFESDEDQQQGRRGGFFGRGGGPPGMGNQGEDESRAREAATRVVATADEGTNSLVVSAAEEVMSTIEKLIMDIDKDIADLTDIRVFPLKYADADEMVEIITELFEDSGQTGQTQQAPQFMRRGRGETFGMQGMQRGSNQQQSSRRTQMQYTVEVAADRRTNSVVVNAGEILMEQIAAMIEQLDADPAKDQEVFVYQLQNADVENVAAILRSMFQEQTLGTSTTSTGQRTNALNEFTSTITEDVQATRRMNNQ